MVTHSLEWDATVKFPPRCSCCEAPTQEGQTYAISLARNTADGKTVSRSVEVPTCEACRAHWQSSQRADSIAGKLLGTGVLIWFLYAASRVMGKVDVNAMSTGQLVRLGGVILLPLIVYLVIAALIISVARPKVEAPHTPGDGQPVRAQLLPSGTIMLRIANDAYGAEVQSLNHAQVEPTPA